MRAVTWCTCSNRLFPFSLGVWARGKPGLGSVGSPGITPVAKEGRIAPGKSGSAGRTSIPFPTYPTRTHRRERCTPEPRQKGGPPADLSLPAHPVTPRVGGTATPTTVLETVTLRRLAHQFPNTPSLTTQLSPDTTISPTGQPAPRAAPGRVRLGPAAGQPVCHGPHHPAERVLRRQGRRLPGRISARHLLPSGEHVGRSDRGLQVGPV